MGLSQRTGNRPQQAWDQASRRRTGQLREDSFPEQTVNAPELLGGVEQGGSCNQTLLAPEISFSQCHNKR